jgi:hypothetical protein
MGDLLLFTHQGAVGSVDLRTRKLATLHGARDSYGGLFGPGLAKGSWEGSKQLARQGYVQNTVNEWHGPARSIVSISDDRMFWIAGSFRGGSWRAGWINPYAEPIWRTSPS